MRTRLERSLRLRDEADVYTLMNASMEAFARSFRSKFRLAVEDVVASSGMASAKWLKTELTGRVRMAAFNPDQPRDEQGQWSSTGGIEHVPSQEWESFRGTDSPDDFYYHVTLEPQAKKIQTEQELRPGKGNMGRGAYEGHSEGRVFLTDRNGVFFWAERAEQHAFDRFDDPPSVAVVRIRKSDLSDRVAVKDDPVGTRDAHAPAYYVEGKINLKGLRTAAFHPDQPRDDKGQWTDGGAGDAAQATYQARFDSADSTYTKLNLTERDVSHTLYPRDTVYKGDEVDGLRVRTDIPNTDSISATYNSDEYEELPGLRSVPLDQLGLQNYGTADDNRRVEHLAYQIKESGEISPLIVVHDRDGAYVLEGNHRARALAQLGKTHAPALVIVAYDDPPKALAFDPGQPRDEHGQWTDGGGGSYETNDEIPNYTGMDPSDHVSKIQNVPIEQVEASETNQDRAKVDAIKKLIVDGEPLPAIVVQFSHETEDGKHDVVTVIDGHHRLQAAKELGDTHVPVRVVVQDEDWSRVKKAGGLTIMVFDPSQPRDEQGQWTDGGASTTGSVTSESFQPLSHSEWKELPADPDYLYHATSLEHAHEIAADGHLATHGPDFGTDQSEWPDGTTEKRSYWTDRPSVAYSFAPEEGKPVLLRVKRSDVQFKKESGTGDYYLRKRVPASALTGVAQDRTWAPLSGTPRTARAWRALGPSIKGFAFDRKHPNVQAWIDDHVAETLDDLSSTTRENIKDLVERSFDGEFDVHDLADEIVALVGDDSRAETIARTETMTASNQGTLEAWDQATEKGLLTGDEQKEWIVTPDDRLCEICEPMDGVTVGLDEDFDVDGDKIDAPPAHPRCRCTVGLTI